MTAKIAPLTDPDFPSLPLVSDDERLSWSEEQRWKRHLQEIGENAETFDRRCRDGIRKGLSEIEAGIAATKPALPTPWMNRARDRS
jgi:hypothetical protein